MGDWNWNWNWSWDWEWLLEVGEVLIDETLKELDAAGTYVWIVGSGPRIISSVFIREMFLE